MLAAKVAFLCRPGSYPELTARVTAIETHMSWLFLTDHHAYKLKKPFRRNGIDHRTLAMRRLGCSREVRLNRRLAPDVYLNVAPLTVTSAGLALGGDGRPVDWLVCMRRLPTDHYRLHRIRPKPSSARFGGRACLSCHGMRPSRTGSFGCMALQRVSRSGRRWPAQSPDRLLRGVQRIPARQDCYLASG